MSWRSRTRSSASCSRRSAIPTLIFQIFGGWIGDRFGPRRTLFLCGLIWATATILTGFAGGLVSLFVCRLLVGIGEGATFPVATRAMQSWTAVGRRGFAQGLTHAFARLGNARHAADRRLADRARSNGAGRSSRSAAAVWCGW